jgi:cytochrome c oxidase subunit 3
VLFVAWRRWFSPQSYEGVELFGLYWHFVDVVWIILFMLIYLL